MKNMQMFGSRLVVFGTAFVVTAWAVAARITAPRELLQPHFPRRQDLAQWFATIGVVGGPRA
jgi:hypothetical protein